MSSTALQERLALIQAQTRARYCKPKQEVEQAPAAPPEAATNPQPNTNPKPRTTTPNWKDL